MNLSDIKKVVGVRAGVKAAPSLVIGDGGQAILTKQNGDTQLITYSHKTLEGVTAEIEAFLIGDRYIRNFSEGQS